MMKTMTMKTQMIYPRRDESRPDFVPFNQWFNEKYIIILANMNNGGRIASTLLPSLNIDSET